MSEGCINLTACSAGDNKEPDFVFTIEELICLINNIREGTVVSVTINEIAEGGAVDDRRE